MKALNRVKIILKIYLQNGHSLLLVSTLNKHIKMSTYKRADSGIKSEWGEDVVKIHKIRRKKSGIYIESFKIPAMCNTTKAIAKGAGASYRIQSI